MSSASPRALSGDTKDALARELPTAAHCRDALREGLVRYGAAAGDFRTQRPAVARLFWSLLGDRSARTITKVATARLSGAPTYEITVPPCVAAALGDNATRRPAARCDRRMELRSAFLACGSLAEPSRGYHLEFTVRSDALAQRLLMVLKSEQIAGKVMTRKARSVVYLKDIEAIVRLLGAIGAFGAVLRLEDVRALKETKNRIRRLVNTEAANVDRAAEAAAMQRDRIAFLVDAHGLQTLSPALREVAALRLQHPTDTLTELGRRCDPPAKKSTVNGRITTLLRLADRIAAVSQAAPRPLRTEGPPTSVRYED